MGAPPNRFKWLLICGGLVCFGLGAVGVFVPGLPTTVFVLTGSYLLTRGAPALDQRMRTSRLFAPYNKYLDPTVRMPRAAKAAALVGMWTSIGASAVLLRLGGASAVVIVAIVLCGIAGSWMILVFRTHVTCLNRSATTPLSLADDEARPDTVRVVAISTSLSPRI